MVVIGERISRLAQPGEEMLERQLVRTRVEDVRSALRAQVGAVEEVEVRGERDQRCLRRAAVLRRGRQELELSVAGSTGIWPSALRCVDSYGRLTSEQPPQGALPLRWTPLSLTPGKYSIQIQIGNQTYSSSFIQH